jgi:hypothetical protein
VPRRKTIVCLANSTKLGSRCVAGVDIEDGEWVRPIGSGDHGAVIRTERTYADGTEPGLLDLIELTLARPVPQPGQPENWKLAPGRWRKAGHLDDDDAAELLEELATDDPIFGSNARSFSASQVAAGDVPSSLALVRPQRLTWTKNAWSKVRCNFFHAGSWHDFPVTDPVWAAEFNDDKPDTTFNHSENEVPFLVISLGEADPRYDQHWKLVAGVVCLPA